MTDTKWKVYVSGPISGLTEDEFKRNFAEACAKVEAAGFEAVNPVEITADCDGACMSLEKFEDGSYKHTWRCYMKYDIIRLLDCDAIYVMAGSENSKGAQTELYIARSLDYFILTDDGEGGFEW